MFKKKTNWFKPKFDDLRQTMLTWATQFTPSHLNGKRIDAKRYRYYLDKNYLELLDEFSKTYPQSLSDSIWRKLSNSDSFKSRTEMDADKAIEQMAKNATSELATAIDAFNAGKVPCPVILKTFDGYYVVAGDAILHVARIIKTTPKVILIGTDW